MATTNQIQHKKNYHCCDATDCKLKTAECRECGKKGHIARACRPPAQEPHPPHKSNQHATHIVTEDSGDYTMFNLIEKSVKPLKVTVSVDNVDLDMEVDNLCQ